ncbi:MAG: hypothetical protein ABSB00_01145 [Minisyncoccia bacterium]|jgi:hypothetical protein
MLKAIATTPWYFRFLPNFFWMKPFVEKVRIVDMAKRDLQPISSGDRQRYTSSYAYAVWVKTSHGNLYLEVSKEVYHRLRRNDQLIVRYQCGRRTERLRGHIAR